MSKTSLKKNVKDIFLTKKKFLKYVIRANQLNLTNRIELFVTLNKSNVEFELKKKIVLKSSLEPNQFLSNRVELRQVRLRSTHFQSYLQLCGAAQRYK